MVQRAGVAEVEVRGNLSKFTRDMNKAERETRSFNRTAQRGFTNTSKSITLMATSTMAANRAMAALAGNIKLVGTLMAGYAIYSGIRSFAEFEGTMNNVRAVSGATASEFGVLNQKAAELGSTTKFTATEVSEAMSFMAMAGLQVGQIYGGVSSTLNLAAAGNLDLGQSADIVTNIMTSMGLQTNELGRAVDVLTKTFTSSNTTLTDLGYAFTYAAPAAATAGLEFEEVAAALGLMGNAGVQGSMAGTAMRGALIRLLSPTKEAKKAMKEIGLEVYDANGNLRSFSDIVRQLEPIVAKGASGVDALATIFGARPFQGIAAVVRQGADALDVMTAKLRNAGGTAEEIANIQMEGLRGAFIELKSAAEGLAIAIGESGLGKALEFLADKSTEALRSMTGAVRQLEPLAKQSTQTLQSGLKELNQELEVINKQIMQSEEQLKNGGSSLFGVFGDAAKTEAGLKYLRDRKAALESNIVSTEEFIRLQIRLKETLTPKFTTKVEKADLEDPGVTPSFGDIDTTTAKRAAALRALQALESEYLATTRQNRKLIEVESARELDNFKKLLDEKLISQEQYNEAVVQIATITQKKLDELNKTTIKGIQEISGAITSGLEGAWREFIENGKVDFKELTNQILADITTIILRMYVLQPLLGGGSSGGGLLGSLLGGIFHTGGKVGSSGVRKEMPASLFIGAPRLHNGGKILGRDEVPAILQRGETVLPAGQGTSSGGVNIEIVNNTGSNVRQESGRTTDGEEIKRFIIDEQNKGIARGTADGAFRSRFGARPVGTRR